MLASPSSLPINAKMRLPKKMGRVLPYQSMHEVYLVARGTSVAVVDGQHVALQAGDLLLVEPGEAHTFVESSDEYFHFVVQAPFVAGDKRSA